MGAAEVADAIAAANDSDVWYFWHLESHAIGAGKMAVAANFLFPDNSLNCLTRSARRANQR